MLCCWEMFMRFTRQLCSWSSILPSRFLWHDPTGALDPLVLCSAWCLQKLVWRSREKWCDSEAIRAGTNMSTDWNVIWCYNHDESVAESNEPVSQKLEEKSTLKVTCRVGAVVVKHDEKQSPTPVMQPDDDI